MKRLTSSSSSALCSVKLGGIVEADEFYIKAGLKGRPYHLEILNSGRLPRHRGLKPWRGRGTYEKENPMITCIHQRGGVGGGMTYFDVRTKQSLISNIWRSVHRHCKVYTDEYLGYRKLKEYGFVHKQVCNSQKEYARRGVVHVNNVEATFTRYGSENSWLSTNTTSCSHIRRPSSLSTIAERSIVRTYSLLLVAERFTE